MLQPVLEEKTTPITRLRQNRIIRKINIFLESPWFVLLVCVLILISNLFGAELIVYPALLLMGIYMAAFGRDFLPLTAVAASSL